MIAAQFDRFIIILLLCYIALGFAPTTFTSTIVIIGIVYSLMLIWICFKEIVLMIESKMVDLEGHKSPSGTASECKTGHTPQRNFIKGDEKR